MLCRITLSRTKRFGAVGDGVHDDLPAICAAHEYANPHGLPVKTRPDATYHLGSKALTAIIATDTDWNTSRFTIDDTKVENHERRYLKCVLRWSPRSCRSTGLRGTRGSWMSAPSTIATYS